MDEALLHLLDPILARKSWRSAFYALHILRPYAQEVGKDYQLVQRTI